jgi:hypothetical protein
MQQINDAVTGKLAAAAYPPLTDGKILYGRSEQFSQSAPSRIIFTRTTSDFVYGTRNVYSRSLQANGQERREQNASRTIAQKTIRFEVRCWGADPSRDLVANDDITEALVDAVVSSIHNLACGSYEIGAGAYTNSTFSSSQIMLEGTEFVFPVSLYRPVLEVLVPYDPEIRYAPSGTSGGIQDYLTTPLGTEAGCEGN